MAGITLRHGYPLHWPAGRPRTAAHKSALFKHDGRAMTLTAAERRLRGQFEMMTRPAAAPGEKGRYYRTDDPVLSSNIRYTASGGRDQNVSRRDPDDCGVSVGFALDGKPILLACDAWNTVADNIAAIAAHIEALRGQERWGVATLAQAFAGHAALPPPETAPAPEQWWQVLGVPATASLADIEAAYRAKARAAHPDTGGSVAAMARLNAARDAARTARA